jgi:hypothetical protein
MIPATVGRVVNFWPGPQSPGIVHDIEVPFAASIAFPWSNGVINVGYIDHNGTHHRASGVDLLQDDDAKPKGEPFCTWMPYQVGQAAKYEAGGGGFAELSARVAELESSVKGMTTPPQVAPPQKDLPPGQPEGTKTE